MAMAIPFPGLHPRACPPCIALSLRVCLLVVLCLASRGSRAEESLQPLSGFVHRAWTASAGAPGAISNFAQTADGMMWITSDSGLFQFDGMHFLQVHGRPGGALSLETVWSLYAPPTGGLWVGLRFGGLVFLEKDRITEYPPDKVIPDSSVDSLAQDRSGALWVATIAGILRFQSGRWERISDDWGLPSDFNWNVFVDRSGAVWYTAPRTGCTSCVQVLVDSWGTPVYRG